MRSQGLFLGLLLLTTSEAAVTNPNQKEDGFQILPRDPGFGFSSGSKGSSSSGGEEEEEPGLTGGSSGSSGFGPAPYNPLNPLYGSTGDDDDGGGGGDGGDGSDFSSSFNNDPCNGLGNNDVLLFPPTENCGSSGGTPAKKGYPYDKSGVLNKNYGGGWGGWGAEKGGWGKWGSKWDWGNWGNGVVPFVIPGTPPKGNDGGFFGKVVDASSRSWKLQIKQCERTKGQKCIHPLATYNVEGSDGSLKANDGKSWTIDCTFTTSIYSTTSDVDGLTGFAYNSPICTEYGAGEPIYTPKSYIWPGDMDSYPDDFYSEDTTSSTKKHHRTKTLTRTASTGPTATSTILKSKSSSATPSKPRSTHAPSTTTKRKSIVSSTSTLIGTGTEGDTPEPTRTRSKPQKTQKPDPGEDPVDIPEDTIYEDPDADDEDDLDVLDRRPIHYHTTTVPDPYTTSFNPDNFIKLTITEGKSELSSACQQWIKFPYSVFSIGGPGGWAGYGGWGGPWGMATRNVDPTDTVTVEYTVTTNGYVTTEPTVISEQRAADGDIFLKNEGSGGAGTAWGYMFAVMGATAVGVMVML